MSRVESPKTEQAQGPWQSCSGEGPDAGPSAVVTTGHPGRLTERAHHRGVVSAVTAPGRLSLPSFLEQEEKLETTGQKKMQGMKHTSWGALLQGNRKEEETEEENHPCKVHLAQMLNRNTSEIQGLVRNVLTVKRVLTDHPNREK